MRNLIDIIENKDLKESWFKKSDPAISSDGSLIYRKVTPGESDFHCHAYKCNARTDDVKPYTTSEMPYRGLCSKHMPIRMAKLKTLKDPNIRNNFDGGIVWK